MLILSRKVGQSIVIDGRIIVKVVRVDGDQIKLGIQAPTEVPVHRQEIFDEIQRGVQRGNGAHGHNKLWQLLAGDSKPATPEAQPPTPPPTPHP
jgi:carbon storage regulator